MTLTWDALEDIFAMHFAKYGLSWPKFNALVQLYLTGDSGLTQSELSTKMVVSRANITGLIERLEKDDLVFRENDPSDKRVLRVYLTDKARRLMDFFMPIHNNFISKVMSSLDKSEKETLIWLLEKVKNGLESI
ncbi:MAG TPA: MarR family transcriptional regulator [Spirochaetia bacterium]|nr:MarR family transcriptional regulator [Spirochaetia bacterium]